MKTNMKTKPNTATFAVKVKMPEDCSVERLRQYIKDAIEYWGGHLSPDDPLFSLQGKVSVKFDRHAK